MPPVVEQITHSTHTYARKHRVIADACGGGDMMRMTIMTGYGKSMVRSARDEDDGAEGFVKYVYPYRSSLVAEPVAPHGVAGSRGQTDATRRGCSVVDDQHVEELEQEDAGRPQTDGQEVALEHEASREVARVETVPEDHRRRECQCPKSERETCKRDQPQQEEEPAETARIHGEREHDQPLGGEPTAGEEAVGKRRRTTSAASIAGHKRSCQGEETTDQQGRTGAASTAGGEAGDQPRRTRIVEEHVRHNVCKRAKIRLSRRAAPLQLVGGLQFEVEAQENGAHSSVAVGTEDSKAKIWSSTTGECLTKTASG